MGRQRYERAYRYDPYGRPLEVHVKVRQDRSLLWFLVFGWWYLGWLVLAWTVRVAWKMVSWPFTFGARATWGLLVTLPLALARRGTPAVRRFHERFGWKGWLVVAFVAVLLFLLFG